MRAFLLAIGAALGGAIAGCGPAGIDESILDGNRIDAGPADDDAGPPGCAGSLDPGICSGLVDPTTLGAGIEPVAAGLTGGAPGSHWYCQPADGIAWNDRILVHLVGTYGDPAEEHRFAARACQLGFVAIAPMYENRDTVRVVCGEDGPCYEQFHQEIVDGADLARDPISVDADDSIRHRIATLLSHLAASRGEPWITARDRVDAHAWRQIAISGHSQGAGHATYLARDEIAERLVLLAGPSDRLGDGTPEHAPAPWIVALETTPLRTTRRFAYMHDDDSFEVVPQVIDNWDRIGVPETNCAYAPSASASDYAGCARVRIASDRCIGLAAHLTVILDRWGARCRAGSGDNRNTATWTHLLLSD